jgi:hypothetical protein
MDGQRGSDRQSGIYKISQTWAAFLQSLGIGSRVFGLLSGSRSLGRARVGLHCRVPLSPHPPPGEKHQHHPKQGDRSAADHE